MKLQKIILCVAVALTAFGASLGLLEIGNYIRTAFQPLKAEVKPIEPIVPPVYAPERIPEFKPPVFTPTAEADPADEPEAEPEDWGVTGDYYILGDNPKGFYDFRNISIWDREYSEKLGKVVSVKPDGIINIGNTGNKEFNITWINITSRRISLVTQAKRGISYQFDGKFVEEETKLKTTTGEEYSEDVHLKGRLTKWRNGVKIAEAKVKLAVYHGC